jgi:hypothetical protein
MRHWFTFVMFAGLLLSGCTSTNDTYRFEIKSDTDWDAVYKRVGTAGQDKFISGTGDKIIKIADPPPVCITVTKHTTEGYVEVFAYKHESNSGGLFRDGDTKDIQQDHDIISGVIGDASACTK